MDFNNPDVAQLASAIFDALMHRNYVLVAALAVVAIVWAIRKFVPAFASGRTAVALTIGVSVAGALVTALVAGTPFSLGMLGSLLLNALMNALMSGGIFSMTKAMSTPSAPPAPPIEPPAPTAKNALDNILKNGAAALMLCLALALGSPAFAAPLHRFPDDLPAGIPVETGVIEAPVQGAPLLNGEVQTQALEVGKGFYLNEMAREDLFKKVEADAGYIEKQGKVIDALQLAVKHATDAQEAGLWFGRIGLAVGVVSATALGVVAWGMFHPVSSHVVLGTSSLP